MSSRLATALLAFVLLAPLPAAAQISLSIRIGPPMLPVFSQPRLPAAGYLWTPGYWAWNPGDQDYYWVPGTWVRPPRVGLLWTPGYWANEGPGFRWRVGYWGPRVGFYGGINYGHGYGGQGYDGGRWQRGVFSYNTRDNNVDRVVVRNVYTTKVVVKQVNVTRVSYNGGPDGLKARPTAAEVKLQSVRHEAPTPDQQQHQDLAMKTPGQKASANRGVPEVAATDKAADFKSPRAVRARDPAASANPADAAAEAKPADRQAGKTPAERRAQAASAARSAGPAASSADAPARRTPKAERDPAASRPAQAAPTDRAAAPAANERTERRQARQAAAASANEGRQRPARPAQKDAASQDAPNPKKERADKP